MNLSKSRTRQSWRAALAGLAVTALAGTAVVGFGDPATAATAARTTLPSPLYQPYTSENYPADPALVLHMRVFLSGRDAAGRVRTAQAVSEPGGADYAHFRTPAQYRQQFGASDAQITEVRGWLTGLGMTVTASTVHYLAVDATIGQAGAAFATPFRTYKMDLGMKGYVNWVAAPSGDVSVPAAIGRDVAAVTDMTTDAPDPTTSSAQLVSPKSEASPKSAASRKSAGKIEKRQATATTDAYPCSRYWGQNKVKIPLAYGHDTAPTQLCGYTPQQMRQAYGVTDSPYTGKGATVAIVLDARSPTMEADANRFFTDHGLPGFAPGQYSENLGADFDCSDWPDGDNPEEALDVETVHMIAPDAKVVFVSAGCNYNEWDFFDAHARIVDNHLADVVSDSWPGLEDGTSPAAVAAWELILQQGAIEGIGFNYASGDYGNGNNDNDPGITAASVGFPTSDPWATAVGGTSLALDRTGNRIAEWGWGDTVTPIGADGYATPPPGSFDMGSGGGLSKLIPEPAYQRGVVPASLATGNGAVPARRVTPDVSANSGLLWLVGYTAPSEAAPVADGDPGPADTDPDPGPPVYSEQAMGGGTSGSSPLLAALEADAKQASGHALGFVNPALYKLARTSALRDVLPVNPADPPIEAGERYCMGEADSEPCLTTLGDDFGLTVTPGFDDVTGIGTPTNSFVTTVGRS
jgi:subtilase family serine protease